ncbi:MAG: hypothetical protein CO189_10055 [candidate division Zixibacteria bacterium CG_4_9_14_3_um_filter_46_8]|nr:MAG: hypothetical protein CO189_10055 [candidate division Zixibacteria bacterium CG_4_9_14_3_um_filter_46_8]
MASIHFKISESGKRTYYVVQSFGGKRKWIKAGTLQDAKLIKKHLESLDKSQRMEKLGVSVKEIRIDSFFQKYSDHIKLHTSPSTVKRYLVIINTFITFLRMFFPHIKNLSQIEREHIESYQEKRLNSIELKRTADGLKRGTHSNKRLPLPQTVNYEFSVLRTAFIWANEHSLIPSVPTKKVKRLRIMNSHAIGRILTPDECNLFLEMAKEKAKKSEKMRTYHKAFIFLLNSGLRSGEICNLTWDDVNLTTGLIKIQSKKDWSPKTYAREFYLNHACLEVLKSIQPRIGHIFMMPSGGKLRGEGLRTALVKITKAAGIMDFTRVHDLRHTFNSLMQMNGVDPATMGKILGHKDIETTMIYTHQTDDHLKASINKLNIS